MNSAGLGLRSFSLRFTALHSREAARCHVVFPRRVGVRRVGMQGKEALGQWQGREIGKREGLAHVMATVETVKAGATLRTSPAEYSSGSAFTCREGGASTRIAHQMPAATLRQQCGGSARLDDLKQPPHEASDPLFTRTRHFGGAFSRGGPGWTPLCLTNLNSMRSSS